MRIKIFFKIISFTFIIVACGLFYTQIIRGSFYYELSQKNRIRLISQDTARGEILDRNNKVLADSGLSFTLGIIPQEVMDKERLFTDLSKVLDIEKKSLIKKYQRNYLAPFAPVEVKDNLTKRQALVLEENAYKLKGSLVQVKAQRNYPYGKNLSHVIGYLAEVDKSRITKLKSYGYKVKDIIGYAGIEEMQDMILRSEKGGMQVEVDNRGRMVRLLGMRPAQKGRQVKLTIDLDMQRIAYRVLGKRKGCIIIIDPKNSAVLSMVSSPAYDPSVFAENKRNQIINLLNDKESPFLNRAISGLYPPASLFKLVTALAALETKKISFETSFFCEGKLKIGNREFKCWDRHGLVDLKQAIARSCDVFFYRTGILVGSDKIADYAIRLGLANPTNIDIGVEKRGLVPTSGWRRWKNQSGWYTGDTANLSIGQGYLLVTPIQMTRLIALFANGGFLARPYLVEEVDGQVYKKNKTSRKRVAVNRKYLNFIREALVSVVTSQQGTAHILDITGLEVAGKTGTAQVAGHPSHAWFIGFAPVDNPKIAFCIFLEYGGSSSVACVLAREMLREMLDENLI